MSETGIFPAYFPIPNPVVAPLPLRTPRQRRPRVSPTTQPEIAARARHESLRDLAACYGVRHETVRTIVRRSTLV